MGLMDALVPKVNGMSDDQRKNYLTQQLLGIGSTMMSASAPSRDPRSGNFGNALQQGLGAMIGGRQGIVNEMKSLQPQAPKPPQTRSYDSGNQKITEEWDSGKGEYKPLAVSSKSAPKSEDESLKRGRVLNNTSKVMKAKYGSQGVRYDSLMGEWIFPPNFDQQSFFKDFNTEHNKRLKYHKLEPIEQRETTNDVDSTIEGYINR